MKPTSQYIALKKQTGSQIIKKAAAHNLREITEENDAAVKFDPALSRLNVILEGPTTASAVASLAKSLMEEAGAKIKRKDCVRAIELVFSLPAHLSVDRIAFFTDAVAWIKAYYSIPVLSAVVHLDESSPHCHVLMLPLRDGKMAGAAITGGPSSVSALHRDFYNDVGSQYGLRRPTKARQLSRSVREKCADLVTTAIQSDVALIDRPEVIEALNRMVANDPLPMMEALEIAVPYPPRKLKTLVETMISPASPEPEVRRRATGSQRLDDGDWAFASNQTISCVRFPESDQLFDDPDPGGETGRGRFGSDDVVAIARDQHPREQRDGDHRTLLTGTDHRTYSQQDGGFPNV
jgi:hypothetical protein